LDDQPSPGPEHPGDCAERALGIGLVHKKGTGVPEVERPASTGRIDLMDIAGHDLGIADAKDGEHRPGTLDRGLAEVDPDDRPVRAHQFRQDRQAAQRAAAALNSPPARDVPDAADRRAGGLGLYLGDAEEPAKVPVAAVEDVVPDPLGY
jgi:hypothetical protein